MGTFGADSVQPGFAVEIVVDCFIDEAEVVLEFVSGVAGFADSGLFIVVVAGWVDGNTFS